MADISDSVSPTQGTCRSREGNSAVNQHAPDLTDASSRLRFVQAATWAQGRPLKVEDLLADFPEMSGNSELILDLLYHEYLIREQSGQLVDLQELVARFPEHEAELRTQVAFRRALRSEPLDHDTPQAVSELLPADQSAEEADRIAPAIPGYEILDEIGYGGMGIIYRARQVETNRIVAIKILSAGGHAAPEHRARFRAEAAMIARLQHPGIVQIFEAGESRGCPFLVLEYVGGGSLRERLNGTLVPPRKAAQLIQTLSRAIDVAHRAGVVHRDLTPGNILFSDSASAGRSIPAIDDALVKITDFGLAKSLTNPESKDGVWQTMSGDVLGTPSYMSPEQAAGRTAETGPGTDVFALGAILYELLTGRPPFREATAVETLQQVVSADAMPPTRLQPRLPRDLETICLKCLQKHPAQRYQRAVDLADDLQRFLNGEGIVARRAGPVLQFTRWCRRKPLLAGLCLLVAMLIGVIGAGTLTAHLRLRQAARDRLAGSRLSEARVHRLNRQLGCREQSLAALMEAASVRPTPEIRDEAIASLALFDMKLMKTGPAAPPGAVTLDLAPDLNLCVSLEAKNVVIRDLDSNAERLHINFLRPPSGGLLSPDGKNLACCWADQKQLEVWRISDGPARRVVTENCDVLWGTGALGFSRDDSLVAVGRPDGIVRIFNLNEGTQTLEISLDRSIRHVAFKPNGGQLAIATETSLELRETSSGRLLVELDEAAGAEFIAWHPRGKLLATSDPDGGISLWEPDRLTRRAILPGHSVGGVSIAFNYSGSLLISRAWDGAFKVWETHWGKLLYSTIGSIPSHIRFSADDRTWTGVDSDRRICVWELPESPAYRRLTPETEFELGHLRNVAISSCPAARGRLLAVAMQLGVGFWDLKTGHPIGHLPIGRTIDIAFDEAGSLLTADETGIRVWPVRQSTTTEALLTIGPPEELITPGTLSQLVCSADGRRIGLCLRDAGGLLIDRDRANLRVSLIPHADVRSIAVTRDGAMAATGSHTGCDVNIWDVQTGALLKNLPLSSSRVGFSPDGRQLLTTGNGLELWSVSDWRPLWRGSGNNLSATAFSFDGRFVAVDEGTGKIRVFAAADGRVVACLEDPYPTALHMLAFAPDGRTLVGISRDLHQMFAWDLASVSRELKAIGSGWELDVAESPVDGDQKVQLAIVLPEPGEQQARDEAACMAALKASPLDSMLHLRHGWLLRQLARDHEARLAFEAAASGASQPLAVKELAAIDFSAGEWAPGIARLESALATSGITTERTADLCNMLAWNLGLAPQEFRDSKRALECAHRAMKLAPANLDYLNTLGLAFYRNHELTLAVETLNRSLRGSSQPAIDLYLLALCHQALGDARRAAGFAQRAEYQFQVHGCDWDRQLRGEFELFRREYETAGMKEHP